MNDEYAASLEAAGCVPADQLMNPEPKRLLVEALRSGEYKQGRYALRVEDRFCCLGVASDLCPTGEWEKSRTEPGLFVYAAAGYREHNYLAPRVALWLGASLTGHFDSTPVLRNRFPALEYGQTELSQLNDSGWTFEEIADFIEYAF